MDEDSTPTSQRSSSKGFAIGCLVALLLPLAIAWGPYLDWSAATEGESEDVTGVVPVRRNGQVYFVVSGHSERTSESSSNNRRTTQTTSFPRLTSFSGRDGTQIAMRQYAPIIRFEYVDTVVRALLGEGGRAWVVSTEGEVGLHAVDPVTLADVVSKTALVARVPALSAGLFIQPGASDSPVVAQGRELVLRTNAGDVLALDPSHFAARELDEDTELDDDAPLGNRAVDALVSQRRHALEPRVAPVFDLDGAPDPTTSYVITQTSLDPRAARVIVTRWDTRTETPTEGWHVSLSDIAPECCAFRAWRYDGIVVLWYEHWLIALDDTNGTRRWARRL